MAFQNRAAFGNIYTIPTTPIDNIANRLYKEQQIREQQKLQQDKALDDEFAKNVAGVKSADIPDITSAYNDFKQAHIALQKKGNKATPQDQMDVMIKKANALQAINASKEDKERIKNRIMEVRADKKGLYNPDAHTVLSTLLNTPTSKRKPEQDDDLLKYKYAMPNIDKEIANAAGKGEEIELPVGVDPSDPLKNKFEVYKRINPPNTFYNNLFTGLAARSDNKNFTRSVMDTLTDDEKDKLRTAYEAKIADPNFKKVYGEVQPFPASAANTELGQAVALKTMEAVVNTPIVKVREKSVPNTKAAIDYKNEEGFKYWDKKRKLTFADSMAKIAANKAAGQVPEDLGYVSDNVSYEVGEDVPVRDKNTGQVTTKRFVDITKVDPERLNIIIGRDPSKKMIGAKPTELVTKDANGNPKTLVGYYVDPNTGDWEGADGQKASREAAKDRYIRSMAGTKFKASSGTKGSENTLPKVKGTTKSGLPVFHK